MSRPRLPLGTHSPPLARGQVQDGQYDDTGNTRWRAARQGETPERWRATCRYRGSDGRTRTAAAWGKSKAAATRRLTQKVREKLDGVSVVAGAMTLDQLGKKWIAEGLPTEKLRPETADDYRLTFDRLVSPALGGLEVRELTPGLITRALDGMADTAPSNARASRLVLRKIFDWAISRDLASENPADKTPTYPGSKPDPRALTGKEIGQVRRAVHAYATDTRPGPPRGEHLPVLIDLMLGTGCRTGEAAGAQWEDFDLEAGTWEITGTIVEPRTGAAAYRRGLTKTDAGHRRVLLPGTLLATLQTKWEDSGGPASGLLFTTRTGGVMTTANLRRALRAALKEAGVEQISPYRLRKTASTKITEIFGAEAAAQQLGHTGPAVTKRHYIEKNINAPDTRAATEALLGGS